MTTATAPAISTVSRAESERAVATIVTAFSGDPIVRWVIPEPQQYLKYAAEMVRRFCGKAFDGESAFAVEAFQGAALWLRPGVEPDLESLGALAEEAVLEEDQEKVFAFLEQQGAVHPHEPHWYLPMIGVDPSRQGLGLGGALLSHALKEVDREGMPAYLEATSERSRDLYARHGFEVVGTIQFADSPPMFPMWRKAR
jgi:ribosomal protein S18 acetylase RimI-like enzyme